MPIAVLLAISIASSQGSVSLRLNPGIGSRLNYETRVSTSIKGQQQTATQTLRQRMEVLKKTAAGFRLRTTITSVDVTGSGPMAGAKGQMQKALLGKSWTADISATGRSSNVSASGGSETQAMLAALQATDAGFMGILYPERPVRVGASWSGTLNLAKVFKSLPGGNMFQVKRGGTIPIKYTLSRLENFGGKSTAVVSFSMKGNTAFTMNMPSKAGSTQPQDMTLSFGSNGIARIETLTGLPTSVTSVANMDMNLGGVSVTQKMVSSVKRI